MNPVRERQVVIKLLAAVVLWGGSFIATKISLLELAPLSLIWLRFGMGVVFLGLVTYRRGQLALPARSEIPGLALLGLVGIAFHQWLQSTGLITSRASTSAWIVASIPVFTALLGWLLLKEHINPIQAFGIFLAAAGVLLVVSGSTSGATFSWEAFRPGDLLILVSAPNWALFSVLSRRKLQKHPPAWTMFYVMLAGWLIVTMTIAIDPASRFSLPTTFTGWSALLFLGVLCSGLAYVYYYDALEILPAARTAVFVNVEPLVTMLASSVMLQESIGLSSVVGGGIILLGVRLVQQWQDHH